MLITDPGRMKVIECWYLSILQGQIYIIRKSRKAASSQKTGEEIRPAC